MNVRFAWVLAATVLAGCSSEWSAGLGLQEQAGAPAAAGVEGALPPPRSTATARTAGFARAPDRGDLLHYPVEPVVRRTGAYTWHSAGLSEEHAMRAIVAGRMRVTAPDGTPIALDYVRHVEHADGNWSWIGRNTDAPGQDAVVTFGPDAVFGSIPQGRDLPPLRLTMADGAGWVVSADPRQLSQIRNAATHPTGPDYLVPPKLSSAGAAAPGVMSVAGAQTQSATASATTTVDVLVGYTNGFASARGGSYAAVTRVHNLVDITNQAYANSQVDARLRLVHSMQVTYPDAIDNRTALEELTGFKAPSTQTTPAPAFSGLRAARDQYGADLVVLLRQSRIPENDGCGVAWLIGGGRSGIEQRDELFGYSVVSDGQDRGSDGQAYFCGEETFAHAIGHNLGFRQDTATDARRLGQAIPAVATFRASADATSVPKGDVDASGTTDLMWFKPGATGLLPGALDIWMMRGYMVERQVSYSTGPWAPETKLFPYVEGAFNYAAGRDIAWRNDMGTLIYWMGGPTYTRSPYEAQGMSFGWRLQASGDRDGDGLSDLYWRSAVDGRLMYWELDGLFSDVGIPKAHKAFAQSPGMDLLMVGDFNGDGLSDLFFRARATGATEIWFPSGEDYTVAPRGRMSKYWRPAGAADYDGDGDDDLVWRSAIDHRVLVWIMQDGVRQDLAVFNSDSDRQLKSVAYLDADRRLDLVWWRADGAVSTWLNTGAGFEHRYIGNRDSSWSLFVGGR